MKFIIFALSAICAISIANIVQAQNTSGFVSANMYGVAASSFQPANLYVQGGPTFDIAFLDLNTSFQTNLFRWAPDQKFKWQYDGHLYGFAVAQNHIQFPSFGIAVGKKAALGLSFSVNHFMNAQFSPKISTDLMSRQPGTARGVVRTNQQAHVLFNSWYALGFSYARSLKENGLGTLKMGVTGQLLIGNGGMAARMVLMDYDVPSRQTIDVGAFFFSSSISHNFDNYQQLGWLWKPEQKMGIGYNTKLGIKWERTNKRRSKVQGVKLDQVGFALLDVGNLMYTSNPNNFLTFHEAGRHVIDLERTFEGMESWKSLRDTIHQYSHVVPLNDLWSIAMPASLYFEVNVLLNEHFAINGTFLKSLHVLRENNLTRTSSVTLTPYFYNDHFALGLPVSMNLMGKAHVGLAFYKGPIMLGLDYVEESLHGLTLKNFGVHLILHRSPLQQERKRSIEICRSL